jgi:ADP-ribose pyrophosphatase
MSEDIRQLSSRTVYSNPWMTVREDDIRFPDGHEGIYGVVEKPDYALIVPIHDDGRIQMVQQYRYTVGARFWEFPQGTAQGQPDIDPEALARAELEEETGFRAGRMERVAQLFQAYGYSNQAFNGFLARDLVPGVMKRDVEEQGMVTAAFRLQQILDMIAEGEIRDASTVAMLGYLRLTGTL